VTIYSVGVQNANEDELRQIASHPPQKHVFIVDSFVHVGVMQFSSRQKPEFSLIEHFTKNDMMVAVDGMTQMGGGTKTGAAISAVSQLFDPARGGRPDLPQRLVVITDGEAQDNVKAPAEELRAKRVLVYAIGVMKANTTQLLEISGSAERMYAERDFDALKALERQLSLDLCDPERGQKILCFQAMKEEKRATTTDNYADLVFLIDQSGSISSNDYSIMKNFTIELVNSFKVGEDLVRVGLAQFSSDFQHEFYLNQFYQEKEVSAHIFNMTNKGGGTNIGLALDSITEYFEASSGCRRSSGISQNLVLITDGDSQDEVEQPADRLRALGIEMFAIGVGDVHDLQLLQITKDPRKMFTVQNFGSLDAIKQKVVDTICKSKPSTDQPGELQALSRATRGVTEEGREHFIITSPEVAHALLRPEQMSDAS
uniref:VWFA domain-containing protein n=1 Tax=Xiphophorus couchianus TaxID=32473 RepID=A0A3B5MTQ1_9TELE